MSFTQRYEVLETLGRGGFGTVYRARFLGEGDFSKEVALKVLNADVEGVDEIARRLRDEARILGLLRHRAIVQVDRLTRIDGRWTVVMEYVPGLSLAALLKAGPIPVGPALEIVAEVSAALHVAQTAPGPDGAPLRLLHRDVKPSNVLVTRFGEVKLLDFGIARAEFGAREAITRSLYFGTPEYMAPERLDAVDGPEGDVYALGAVLVELLTGTAVGRSSARRDRHEELLGRALAGLRARRAREDLIALLAETLAWEPRTRPTAGDLERRTLALRASLGGEPLRFWAERTIGRLAGSSMEPSRPALGREHASGSLLVERTPEPSDRLPSPAEGAPSAPPAPRPVAPRRGGGRLPWIGLSVALVLAAAGACAGLVVVVYPRVSGTGQAPAAEAPPGGAEAARVVELAPATGSTAPFAQPAATTAPPEPDADAATAAAAAPVAETPATAPPAPARSAPRQARVSFEGDAERVELCQGDACAPLPGRFSEGSWEIRASFPGYGAATAGRVEIEGGVDVVLRCLAQFMRCKVVSG